MAISKCGVCEWSGKDEQLVHQQAGPRAVELKCPQCGSNRFIVANCINKGEVGNGSKCNFFLESGVCSKSETCPSQVFGRVNPGGLNTISIPVLEVDEETDRRVEDYFAKKGK